MALEAGSRLGAYEVVELVGSGGMGEVYRARDPRLGREVAIKILPGAADRGRLGRFEQEARAAGALNHPNVLAVHDVGSHQGAPYVVTELLEGHTLSVRLEGGALPVRKALDCAIQIASGLAAAHDRGIVHRDLKPDNIFITEDGQVKILDFGLAKLTRPGRLGAEQKATAATRRTESGTVMGTVGYMSPEQVRGEEVDQRSDVFSFGVVLYEMLSGRRAFRRPSAAETMNAILKEDPPELSLTGRDISPGLARVVHRCLEKRPGDRLHSAHDLALALEAVSVGVGGSTWPTVMTPRRLVGAGALVGLIAVTATTGLWISRFRESDAPAPPLRVRPLTSDSRRERDPALSPDGNLVAYVRSGESGAFELCVKQVDGGGDPIVIASGAMAAFEPAWSRDGQRIAFLRHDEGEAGVDLHGVYVIPTLGGAEQRLFTSRAFGHALSWSPDGRFLAINDRDSAEAPDGLFLLSLETGARRRLTSPPEGYAGDSQARFSPDGRMLAFVRSVAPFETDIYVVPVGGGNEWRLTQGNYETGGLDWTSDGQAIIFSSWRLGGAGEFSLWRVAASGGDPEPLEFGEHGERPTVSRKGGRLAYLRNEWEEDIWRVSGPRASGGKRSAAPFISSSRMDYDASYSADGRRIAFVSSRAGPAEIWICDSDGSSPRQLTFLEDPLMGNPTWSPDGGRIAFHSAEEGIWRVHVVSLSGGVPRRLTSGPRDVVSSWSRDGRWIYFFSNRSGRNEVWKVSPAGGRAVQVTTHGGTIAIEAPDDRYLYYGKGDLSGRLGIWRIPSDGGDEIQVLDRADATLWTFLDQGILYVNRTSTPLTLELFDLASRQVTWAAPLEGPLMAPVISASPDGRWVLYAGSGGAETDILLVEGFR